MKIYGKSDIGLKRQTNQDCFYSECMDEDFAFVIVCDGMGGVNGGGTASRIAVDSIKDQIKRSYNKDLNPSAIRNLLESSVYNANMAIYQKQQEDPLLNGMGTTVVVSIIFGDHLYTAHIGDSRAYIISNNNINQITTDHSIVQQMVDKGEITKEEAMHHPRKNLITRALGVDQEVPADYIEKEFYPSDTLVLCTDGLSNYISEKEIYNCYKNNDIDLICDILISKAKDLGGDDNITVVLLQR